jgi:hypothetical protein
MPAPDGLAGAEFGLTDGELTSRRGNGSTGVAKIKRSPFRRKIADVRDAKGTPAGPRRLRYRSKSQGEDPMYLARFSYDVLPVDRQRAIDFIRREVTAARAGNLEARLLVPFTRGQGGPALQFEVQLDSLDRLDRFRGDSVAEKGDSSADWMHSFSAILRAPPIVEVLKVDEES